jgi:perosamine synthetase
MINIAKPLIGNEEKEEILKVLDSGMLSIGKWVKDFEAKFADYIGVPYAFGTSSGTTALHLALQAAGIGWGDKVVTTPFTFIATANSILYCGAQPVFCDIDPETFNLSPGKLRALLKQVPGIKALLIVHLYGLPCVVDEFLEIAKENKLIIIEDCAQAHGALYKGQKVGSFGNASIFSFYPTKNMTTGEGGMVLTSDPKIAEGVKLLREHGADHEYEHQVLGYNYRLTNMGAAIGIEQLKKLEAFNDKRIQNSEFFFERLKDIKELKLPWYDKSLYKHVFHQFTIRLKLRDELAAYLKEKGIGSKVYYPKPLHKQPLYQKLGYGQMSYPECELASKEVLSLPVHPALSAGDLELIVESIRNFFNK